MAEKIHSQQPAQLKGCFYFPSPKSRLQFVHPNKVAPLDQSPFYFLERHTLWAREIAPIPFPRHKDTALSTRSNTVTRKSALVSSKSYLSLFTRAQGLLHTLHTISSLVFFLFDTTQVEQNAHWRTIVVTQQ